MTIPLLLNYGRSGGTLINQCLGALPNTIVLSEVNHVGGGWGEKKDLSPTTVWDQAAEWQDIEIKSRNFVDATIEMAEYCEKNGIQLILRDWVFKFYGRPAKSKEEPSFNMETIKLLSPHLDIVPFVFVRNAIDMWISFGMRDISPFFDDYFKFVKEIKDRGYPIFKYENFCKNPQQEMQFITDKLNLNFDSSFEKNYHLVQANGNTQKKNSRGIKAKRITLLPRKRIPYSKIKVLENSERMRESNQLLGYSTKYFDEETSYFKYWFNFFKTNS